MVKDKEWVYDQNKFGLKWSHVSTDMANVNNLRIWEKMSQDYPNVDLEYSIVGSEYQIVDPEYQIFYPAYQDCGHA